MGNPLLRPFEFLAPEELASRPSLPVTLLFRPAPLLALVLLVANDQWAKSSGLFPSLITGKLSDFAGLFLAPLLVVTILNMGVSAIDRQLGAASALRSPSMTQIAVLCAAIAALFTSLQVNVRAAELYADVMGAVSFWSTAPRVPPTPDPTDLVALVAVAGAFFYARRAIAKCPPGRIALLQRVAREVQERDLPDAESALLHHVKDILVVIPEERVPALEALCAHVLAGRSDDVLDLDLQRLRGEAPLATSPIA